MRSSSVHLVSTALFCLVGAAPAGAVAVDPGILTATFASQAQVSTVWPCPSYCGGPGAVWDFDLSGGVDSSFAEAQLHNAHGLADAQARLSGAADLPELKAQAYSHPVAGGTSAGAIAAGMQGFFVGAGGLPSYQLTINLSGEATYFTSATVALFRDDNPSTAPGFSADSGTMVYEIIALSDDLDLQDLATLDVPDDGQVHQLGATLTISGLQEGQLFYVWANLDARGLRGTYGDAYDTLTMSFVDARGLSHVGPVPEPAAALTLLVGLGVLGARLRLQVRPPR
jgi:hypothetical protein